MTKSEQILTMVTFGLLLSFTLVFLAAAYIKVGFYV